MVPLIFGIFLRVMIKIRVIYEEGGGGGGVTVFALLILFFLRGIVNSPHSEGVWLLNGL